ncbi:hypothetical protein QQZ08_009402 [Neonectria magnoliae]|uniref:Protein kinase domain-containing protein n=1 Tax=Neonectria magnoliae TaxID=2732573 RepID=A0ABR1HPM8_9HYPO
MAVDILSNEGLRITESTAFLKLFDRRFSNQLRRDNGIEPWTEEMEQAYDQSVQSGAVYQFLDDLHRIENFQDDTEEDWDDAQNEAFLADELLRLYKTEVAVYDRLHEYQGRVIPRLLAAIDIDIAPTGHATEVSEKGGFEPFKVKGLLLQYIDGCDLWGIVHRFPRSSWQDIVDQALAIIRVLGDYNILNKDVRPENFMVSTTTEGRQQEEEGQHRVFMIDFALCRFREQDESDLEWGRAKFSKDEEGAIALRMKKLLSEKHDFQLHYEDPLRYLEWAEREDSFPDQAAETKLGQSEAGDGKQGTKITE